MFAFLCSIIAVHASSLVGACACLEMHDREELLIRIGTCLQGMHFLLGRSSQDSNVLQLRFARYLF